MIRAGHRLGFNNIWILEGMILPLIMNALSIDRIFDAAVQLLLIKDESITLTFTPEGVRIRFPTTRGLADFLQVPHYYILPYFGMMEEEGLITRAERVGILTTSRGSERIFSIMREKYSVKSAEILGPDIKKSLLGPWSLRLISSKQMRHQFSKGMKEWERGQEAWFSSALPTDI